MGINPGVISALPYMAMMLLLLHTSRLLWWSYSATFMCYEYSCMQYSFCNRMFVPEDVWNLAIFMNSCTCARQRVGIWLYSCIVGWTQVKHSWLCYKIFDNVHVEILFHVCVVGSGRWTVVANLKAALYISQSYCQYC